MNTTARTGTALAFGAALISGVSVFVNAHGVKHFGNATVYTTAKNGVAAIVLIGLAAAAGVLRPGGRNAVTRPRDARQWAWLAAIAVVGGSVPFILFFEGLARATSGPVHAQLINKTLVIWVVLLAVPLLGERVRWPQLAAIGLLAVGQVSLAGGFTGTLHMSFGSGEAMILAATVLWAIEVVVARHVLRELSSWTVGLARMLLGSALLVGWVIGTGKGPLLASMDAQQWRWVLLVGALLGAYVATWLAALALAPAVQVTAVLVAAVPVTAVLQAVADGAALRPQAGGLSLITLGCALLLLPALGQRRQRRQRLQRPVPAQG